MPGSDADVILINPAKTHTFGRDTLHTTCGYSPYDGMTTDCAINLVMLRGQIIARDNTFTGQKGYGTLLHRKRTIAYEDIVRV